MTNIDTLDQIVAPTTDGGPDTKAKLLTSASTLTATDTKTNKAEGRPRKVRDRSVPLPPPFNPAGLSDDHLLTSKELAGWLRLALVTLECWRRDKPPRGPTSIVVAGRPRYRVGDVRRWLTANATRAGRQPTGASEKE